MLIKSMIFADIQTTEEIDTKKTQFKHWLLLLEYVAALKNAVDVSEKQMITAERNHAEMRSTSILIDCLKTILINCHVNTRERTAAGIKILLYPYLQGTQLDPELSLMCTDEFPSCCPFSFHYPKTCWQSVSDGVSQDGRTSVPFNIKFLAHTQCFHNGFWKKSD